METLPVLTLHASAAVPLPPNKAVVTLGVVARSTQSAQHALNQARVVMNRVVENVRNFDVQPRDVQTSRLKLAGQVIRSGETEHTVSNQLTIRLRAIDRLGDLLDVVVASGSNTIEGVQFGTGEHAAAQDSARRSAFLQLQSGAALYAEVGGFSRAKLRTVTERVDVAGTAGQQIHDGARTMDFMATPTEAGELNVTVSLSATYELVR